MDVLEQQEMEMESEMSRDDSIGSPRFSNNNSLPSQIYSSGYPVDVGMEVEVDSGSFLLSDVGPGSIFSTRMEVRPPGIFECSSNPTTRDSLSDCLFTASWSSSPTSIDTQFPALSSPSSSLAVACQPPGCVLDCSESNQPVFQEPASFRVDQEPPAVPEDFNDKTIPQQDDVLAHEHSIESLRPWNEGESKMEHDLYRKASPYADGLFHCPWEGQLNCNHTPGKWKRNYFKMVDSHIKPYKCRVEACKVPRFSSQTCLLRHERESHGLYGHGNKPFLCLYENCERAIAGNGFSRQCNLKDHMKRIHNGQGRADWLPSFAPRQQYRKGRRRIAEVLESDVTSGGKARLKSMRVRKDSQQISSKRLHDEWLNHRGAVLDIIRGLLTTGVRSIKQVTEMRQRLSAMSKITSDLTEVRMG